MAEPVVKVGTVVINVNDVEKERAFWTALLDVGVANEIDGLFVWLEPQRPGGMSIALQLVPDQRTGARNRLHLDTAVADLGAARALIESLGGSHVEDHEMGGFRWTVMADPEGNEFCIAREG